MRLVKLVARWFALLSAPLLAWPTHATIITVASDLPNGYIGHGSSTTGTFDVNASAAALGFTSPMSVTSATLSFQFRDNTDPYTTTSGFSGSSTLVQGTTTCGATLGSCVEHYYWVDRYGTSHSDAVETARVTVGNQTADASSPFHQTTQGPTLTAQGQTVCGWLGCGFVPVTRSDCGSWLGSTFCTGPWPVYSQNWTYYSAYDGNFSLNLDLDAAGLLDLGTEGLLDFSLSAFAGDFNFLSATLTADIFARTVVVDPIDPVNPTPPVGVPEPSTYALFFAAFFAFAATRKGLGFNRRLTMVG